MKHNKTDLLPMNLRVGTTDDLTRTKYIFEPKLDGIRALCYVNNTVRFSTRSGRNVTNNYPEFVFRAQIEAKTCILDGEIIALDKHGVSSFSLLQQGHEAMYVVFDILERNGKSLLAQPLVKRKEILDTTVIDGAGIEKIIFTADGKKLWKKAIIYKLEGVIAKEKNSLYYPNTRSSVWLKIKRYSDIDAAIIGFTEGKHGLASLALGLFKDNGTLKYIGKVGTGFSQQERHELLKQLKKSVRTEPPLEDKPSKDIIWVKPKRVAQVQYVEITKAGKLRSPSFIRFREDKKVHQASMKEQWPLAH